MIVLAQGRSGMLTDNNYKLCLEETDVYILCWILKFGTTYVLPFLFLNN